MLAVIFLEYINYLRNMYSARKASLNMVVPFIYRFLFGRSYLSHFGLKFSACELLVNDKVDEN